MNFKDLADTIGLEEGEYRELVELFLATAAADCDNLQTAFAVGDAQQVARSAHTISGSAGNLRMMHIHETAKRIERAACDNQLHAVAGDVDSFKGYFEEIAGLMQA